MCGPFGKKARRTGHCKGDSEWDAGFADKAQPSDLPARSPKTSSIEALEKDCDLARAATLLLARADAETPEAGHGVWPGEIAASGRRDAATPDASSKRRIPIMGLARRRDDRRSCSRRQLMRPALPPPQVTGVSPTDQRRYSEVRQSPELRAYPLHTDGGGASVSRTFPPSLRDCGKVSIEGQRNRNTLDSEKNFQSPEGISPDRIEQPGSRLANQEPTCSD